MLLLSCKYILFSSVFRKAILLNLKVDCCSIPATEQVGGIGVTNVS